jgi:acyl carrier protein
VTSETDDIDKAILGIVAAYGNLSTEVSSLSDDDDLFRAGMTSHASVTVMLELETRFDIEFPDDMLRKSTFESVSSIRSAVCELLVKS